MKRGFTDIHQHVLYGLDDGPQDAAGMHRMLLRAADQNITHLFATPHVTPGVYQFNLKKYYERMDEASRFCQAENLNIKLYEGAEILYTDQTCRFLNEQQIPTLAGTNRVLVEFSPDIQYEKLFGAMDKLLSNGYVPVIAHVERYDCLTHHPARAKELKERLQVRFQMNCQTAISCKGFFKKHFVKKMLRNDMIDALGTDAHNTHSRPARMKHACQIIWREYGAENIKRIVVERIAELEDTLQNYDQIVRNMGGNLVSNNAKFCDAFKKIVDGISER